jgi:hypothetical protein
VIVGSCSSEQSSDGAPTVGPIEHPADVPCTGGKVRWLRDVDGDGSVDPRATVLCAQPSDEQRGFVVAQGAVPADCDDNNPSLASWAWSAAPESAFVCVNALSANEVWLTPVGSYPHDSCSLGWDRWDVDRDGDGYAAEGLHLCVPSDSEARDGLLLDWNGIDCNDADPNAFTEAYWDGDEDGAPDALTKSCLGSANSVRELPTSQVSVLDCDPSDPLRAQQGRFDRDADGYATIEGCYPKADAPDVATDNSLPLDCEDDNAAVNPGALEYFDDGIDGNCDGDDNPHCRGLPLVAVAPSTGKCSDTADVAVAAVLECSKPCAKLAAHIQLQNHGHVLFDGTVRVSATSDSYTWTDEFHAFIAPGDVGTFGPLSIERDDSYHVSIETDRADCDSSNDALEVSLTRNRCRVTN